MRRIGYRLNENQEIELWLWPSLDIAPGSMSAVLPARYVVLAGVTTLDLQYLNADAAWVNVWPNSRLDPPIPRAVRVRDRTSLQAAKESATPSAIRSA